MNDDQRKRTQRRAYELWKKDGSPEGNGEQYWHQAAHEIMERGAVAEDTTGSDVRSDVLHELENQPPASSIKMQRKKK